jgi:flagellar biosynthesis protein FliR
MHSDLVAGEVGNVLLVFARLGAALMVVPGFGEHYVLPRLRLLLALALSLLVAPVLASTLPPLPEEPLALAALVAPEILLGLLLGFAARLALVAVHVGGSLIATQSGLSAAALFDPNEATPGTLPGTFLTVAALAILFAADLHHLLLRAAAASYAAFPVAAPVDLAAASELLAELSSSAIATGAQIAAPLILAAVLVNLGLGALGRMVPSLPALFVALPLQLLLALVILELSLPASLRLVGEALARGVGWLERAG